MFFPYSCALTYLVHHTHIIFLYDLYRSLKLLIIFSLYFRKGNCKRSWSISSTVKIYLHFWYSPAWQKHWSTLHSYLTAWASKQPYSFIHISFPPHENLSELCLISLIAIFCCILCLLGTIFWNITLASSSANDMLSTGYGRMISITWWKLNFFDYALVSEEGPEIILTGCPPLECMSLNHWYLNLEFHLLLSELDSVCLSFIFLQYFMKPLNTEVNNIRIILLAGPL